MSFSKQVITFYKSLKITAKLPADIEVMNPYKDKYTLGLCEQFYSKYYNDSHPRHLMVGINPGRFGSGATGISFTDPVKLERECGIANSLGKKTELSADFIYKMIGAYGGPDSFYQRHFISAVSPLGFTRYGKNINYYDVQHLQKAITPFIIQCMECLILMNLLRDKCFCIGEGKNFEFLRNLNDQHHWFDEIVPLAHPRFIMQYKRKQINTYIDDYLEKLKSDSFG